MVGDYGTVVEGVVEGCGVVGVVVVVGDGGGVVVGPEPPGKGGVCNILLN